MFEEVHLDPVTIQGLLFCCLNSDKETTYYDTYVDKHWRFYVLLNVHLSIILVINKPNAQILVL